MDVSNMSCPSGIPPSDMENLFRPLEKPTQALAILHDIVSAGITSRDDLNAFLLKARRKHHTMVSMTQLLALYRSECEKGVWEYDPMYEELFQAKGFRSQSGVLVIAVFTSPYPETVKNGEIVKQAFSCEYDCYYCPAEPNQPRSYLLNEPGVLRANANHFDPVDQFTDRATTYMRLGHPIDKIELLVLGGTWSSYPRDYQDAFVRDIFYAANTFFDAEKRPRLTVEEEIRLNETTQCRIIGLTLETRPDRVTGEELRNFRRLGVTRIQMGVQHTDERMLERINRRCTPDKVVKALKLAKDCCFKVDIHLMPDLPQPLKPGVSNKKNNGVFDPEDIDQEFSVLEADKKMFDTVIHHPDWQADQWKIYPCEVTAWTRIEEDFKRGSYKPYGHQTHAKEWTPLFDLLVDVMSTVKPWVRLNRVIRDIPTTEILGGNMNVSMRQNLDLELKKRGLYCMDIRNREVKKRDMDVNAAVLKTRMYDASGGKEYFLSFETADERILFGFLRLRLTDKAGAGVFPELEGAALIRELHVYGQVKKVSQKKSNKDVHGTAQHSGLGRRLLAEAERIAREEGYSKMAVISGVGVKNYYRKFGYEDEEFFMTKTLPDRADPLLCGSLILLFVAVLAYILGW
jgi:ELP3 family radical SAM enzyme/protein acetyltransferase